MNDNSAPPVVLVADDEPTMLELVARHLRSMDRPKLEVIEASDGDEAWRLARERLPDLVVLDVMMPGMSGWEVCRKIRQDAALAHTGVLMLTGIGESLNEATSPLFGADDYIDKPFDLEQLDERIVNVLERRSAQREAVPRPVATAGKSKVAGSARRHHLGNGVGGPAKVATTARVGSKRSTGARKTKPSTSKHQAKRKQANQRKPAKAEKGKKVMAAKKAKKGAKKAKKGAKKGKKK